MKKLSQILFLFSTLLFTISFITPSYGQNGPPPIRPESRGGGGNPNCDLINNGEDQTLRICLSTDISYFENCSLNVGFDLINSDMIYVDANANYWNQTPSGDWRFCFDISFSGQEIADMCAQQIDFVQLDYFCLNNGEYENIYNESPEPALLDMCCSRDPDYGTGNRVGNNSMPFSTTNSIKLIQDSDLESKITSTDFYIYDIHGNQINVLTNESIIIPLQQYISDLNIRSGIYIVKYWNGQKEATEKIYKF